MTLTTEFYLTGKPCRNGHLAKRRASDGRCTECRAETGRRTYANHAERIKTNVSARYAANREEGLKARRDYHARNKADSAYQAKRKAYMVANHERLLALQRERNASVEMKARKAALRKENAHKYRGYEQKRRARLQHAVPSWFGEIDEFVLSEAAELCALRARATGFEWQIDHMIPILARRATGLHCAANIQVIPGALNRSKNNRMILTDRCEWLSVCADKCANND